MSKNPDLTQKEILDLIRKKIKEDGPGEMRDPHLQIGDVVQLDNHCIGIVSDMADDHTTVYYWEDNEVKGPSYGWELELVFRP